MQDSLYTKIIKNELPSHKIYEDDQVIAFLDIHPQQPGHTLVVPKMQVDLIWDLPDDAYSALWVTARKIAQHLAAVTKKRIGVHVDGTGVPHAHIHLVPFTTTAEFTQIPDQSKEPDHAALAAEAERLRIQL